ncbi:isochorismatase family protein [Peribacillus sp. TH16]|uniref:isochorismatase family protein n=1 Tax=Peribacillus sp. TH24 TaxID=2798483 RepID=UPI0019146833|nr:isochorismatase family protein [Peribacillus sp. TH24]MBK5444747.1 isochorismatase family protein [Peribacillus sp. TH24]MBK5460549.1 isochorismatase family protein [Peribacillus sp. TH27]MBK5482339.1 isochorismatase family protein [Peribacillus sp. TH16]MBK5498703.1 isochorismatase family protein [Peribacillus sp. TH14]
MTRSIQAWRESNRQVIYILYLSESKDSLFYPENETSRFKAFSQSKSTEWILTKYVNSAFIATNLEKILREEACPQVVITGLTTNHCVETTTRMSGNLGFIPILG